MDIRQRSVQTGCWANKYLDTRLRCYHNDSVGEEIELSMAQVLFKDVLVRKVDIATLEKLKAKAKRQNRSLQAEMQFIFRDAAERVEPSERLDEIRRIRASIKNRNQTDSAILLREDRDR